MHRRALLCVELMHRTTRSIEFTAAGDRTVRHARRVLSILEAIQQEAADGGGTVRIGYAWSALGRHTTEFQRRWADAFPNTELRLIRTNTPTAGLAEGTSDFAILRRVPDTAATSLVLIGLESRFCAMAADDALAGKRSITLAEAAAKPIALDRRTGSTRLDLWPEGQQPQRTIATDDVDDWLTVIGSGKARGITAESTAHQYRRKELSTGTCATPPQSPFTSPGPSPTRLRGRRASSSCSRPSIPEPRVCFLPRALRDPFVIPATVRRQSGRCWILMRPAAPQFKDQTRTQRRV
ncbi:LysR family transcriptional regulator [Pseudarthrobacter sp. MDT3-26]|uniref:LysR family transcriptional regulator n=1 Tax=Pseudarthrobacter raffinosi TaxID=2953651 RepID=UPI00208FE3B5|nr:LysR family transcriptional regulator [Pseudarthrobacter sp. MDT3-26]MCO4264750.1 LysR family transcriptional regulator [Pseudarthrobacter sp. MDT3-26]